MFGPPSSSRRLHGITLHLRGAVVAAAQQQNPGPGRQLVDYKHLGAATKEQLVVCGELFSEEKALKQADRVLDLVRALRGCHLGHKVDLYEHSLQTASRAYRDGADEETVVVALLHDIAELISPNAHGEMPPSILRPYVSDRSWWVLMHHGMCAAYRP